MSELDCRYAEDIRKEYGVELQTNDVSFVALEDAEDKGNRYVRHLVASDSAEMRLGKYYIEFNNARAGYEFAKQLRLNGGTMPPDVYEEIWKEFKVAYRLEDMPDSVIYVTTKNEHEKVGEYFKQSDIFKNRMYFSLGEYVICTKDAKSYPAEWIPGIPC